MIRYDRLNRIRLIVALANDKKCQWSVRLIGSLAVLAIVGLTNPVYPAFDEGEVISNARWCEDKMWKLLGASRCRDARQLSKELGFSNYVQVAVEGSGNRLRVTVDFWNSSAWQCMMVVNGKELRGEGWVNPGTRGEAPMRCTGQIASDGNTISLTSEFMGTNQTIVLRRVD